MQHIQVMCLILGMEQGNDIEHMSVFFNHVYKQNINTMTTIATPWPKVWLFYGTFYGGDGCISCCHWSGYIFPRLLVLLLFILREPQNRSGIWKLNNLTSWWRTKTLALCLFSTQCRSSLLRVLGIGFFFICAVGKRVWTTTVGQIFKIENWDNTLQNHAIDWEDFVLPVQCWFIYNRRGGPQLRDVSRVGLLHHGLFT